MLAQQRYAKSHRILANCDEADTFLSLVPMHLRMPYVSISNALPFDFSGQAPLCFFDTPFDPSPEGLARNREQLQSAEPIFAPCKAVGRAYAEKVGLEVDWTDPFATVSKVAWLTQMPKEFDFTSSHFPPQFHYTGPFHDSAGRAEADFPWDWLTGRRWPLPPVLADRTVSARRSICEKKVGKRSANSRPSIVRCSR